MASEINTASRIDYLRTGKVGFDSVKTFDSVIQAVRNYTDGVRKVFPVVKAFLFGSWAKGNATKFSDVDVCFFLESYGGRRQIDVLTDITLLMLDDYSWLGVELHACLASSLESDNQFVREVLRTGIEIWPGRDS
ncbi:MAG: nucleotidyltransferase domain-containing protein [Deltaproteobacteria bacterium]|jgi:predicted nucleotidyltransferase|nr:nucleotidyltransferase domain-containing protein [Deltaproteobacteria bacterium]